MTAAQKAAYAAYQEYIAASQTFWQQNGGLAPGAALDPKAFGPAYQFDPSMSAATYQNITSAVRDETIAHATGVNPGINSTPPPQPAGSSGVPPAVMQRTYQTVDNGVSSIAEYGFGNANSTGQGGPAGGYSDSATTYGGGTTNYGTPYTGNDPRQGLIQGAIGSPQAGGISSPLAGLGQFNGQYPNTPVGGPSTTVTYGAEATAPTGSTGALDASNPNAASNLSGTQRDAYAYLADLLNQYGLGSLSKFVITELTAGRSQAEIALDLQQTPEFKAAFPEIEARKAAGLPALSPGEIVSYRNSATQLLRAAGMPAGFYDSPQDFQALLSGDVSLSELNDRINEAKDATYNIDPATQNRLSQEFGLHPGSGGLAAFFLDPNKALPLLQRQVAAAKIGGAADEVGYKNLNNATALDLAQAGVTDAQARQGFNTLGKESELFNGLPGQQQEQNIGQGQQLAATFLGNVDAEKTIEQRRQSRQSQFTDGGGFASSNSGLGGLGTVQR